MFPKQQRKKIQQEIFPKKRVKKKLILKQRLLKIEQTIKKSEQK